MPQTAGGQAPARRDAVAVDSKHYTVELENERVRVLRARYGPGEKSVMHGHPNTVVIALSPLDGRFTYPDGTSQESRAAAGQVMYMDAEEHLPENVGSEPFEVIIVELKG